MTWKQDVVGEEKGNVKISTYVTWMNDGILQWDGAIGYDQVGYNGEKTIILVLDILMWRRQVYEKF